MLKNKPLDMGVTVSCFSEYRSQIKQNRCDCGFKGLKNQPIEHYAHGAGWTVEGFNTKQWLYITCPKCQYQWALWKLGVPREKEA